LDDSFGRNILAEYPFCLARPLGNIVVLAMQAPEIAPDRRNGKGLGTWIEVKKRLFFYGIDMVGAGKAIDEAVKGTAAVFPDAAYPSFPLGYDAIMTA
jgi:hypothetical protein